MNRAAVRSAVVGGSALVVGSTLVWHLTNFGFNAIASHTLGPTRYGNLTAAVTLLALANPILAAIQTVASRFTTALVASGQTHRLRGLLRFYGIRLGWIGLFVAGGIVLASRALGRFLREPSPWPIAIVGIAVFLSLATHLQRGILQGSSRFRRYSASTVVEAVTRIALLAVLLLLVSRSVEAAVAAIAAGSVVGIAANAVLLRYLPHSEERERPTSHPYGYSLLTLGVLILLALLFAADVLAGKRYLDPHTAGLYAAVSLSGKVVFFATSAVSLLVFPAFSSRQDEGRDSRRLLGGALGVVAVGSALIVALYELAPGVVVTPLFGSAYSPIKHHLPSIGVAYGLYAVAYLAALYLLSHGRSFAMVVLAGAVLTQLAALYIWHASIVDIIRVQLAVFGGAALLLVVLCLQRLPAASGVGRTFAVEPR